MLSLHLKLNITLSAIMDTGLLLLAAVSTAALMSVFTLYFSEKPLVLIWTFEGSFKETQITKWSLSRHKTACKHAPRRQRHPGIAIHMQNPAISWNPLKFVKQSETTHSVCSATQRLAGVSLFEAFIRQLSKEKWKMSLLVFSICSNYLQGHSQGFHRSCSL